MAILYDVGPDSDNPFFSDKILRDCFWIVYWYTIGSYEGYGEAVAFQLDGKLIMNQLDHCSCYGPIDHWGETEISVEDLQAGRDHVLAQVCKDCVTEKVLELMGVVNDTTTSIA